MSDIALFWNIEQGAADVSVAGGDLVADDGLETAVLLSLFTERRAEDGDALPDGETDRRGWWGDSVADVEGDRIGSQLWLLAREKQAPATLARAVEYAREALAWLVEDQVASQVDVSAEAVDRGVWALNVTIYRPTADPVNYRYTASWAAQEARRIT